MLLALLVALLAPAPAQITVWSTRDGRAVQTIRARAVDAAWFGRRNRVFAVGDGLRGPVKRLKAGGEQPRTLAGGRFALSPSGVLSTRTGRLHVRAPGAGHPFGAGWLAVDSRAGLAEYRLLEGAARVRTFGRSQVQDLVFMPAPDGPRLVVLTSDPPTVHVLGGSGWPVMRSHRVLGARACAARSGLVPAGDEVLLQCGDTIYRFEPRKGRPESIASGVHAHAASHDGRVRVMVRDQSLHVIGADGKALRAPIRLYVGRRPPWPAIHLAVSPDGRHAAASWLPGGVQVIDLISGERIWRRAPPARAGTTRVDYLPDGRLLIRPEFEAPHLFTVDFSGAAPVEIPHPAIAAGPWPAWSALSDGTPLFAIPNGVCVLGPHRCAQRLLIDGGRGIAAAPDRPLIAVASRRRVTFVRLDGQRLPGQDDRVRGRRFEPARAATGPWAALGRQVHPWFEPADALGADGPWRVVAGSGGLSGLILNDDTPAPVVDFDAPFIVLGDRLIWATEDTSPVRLRAWDLAAGRPLPVESPHTRAVEHIARSLDGAQLATAGADHRVVLWDVATLTPRHVLRPDRSIEALDFSPDGQRLMAVLGRRRSAPPPLTLGPSGTLTPVADRPHSWTAQRPIRAVAAVGESLLIGHGRALVELARDRPPQVIQAFADEIHGVAGDARAAYVLTSGARALSVVDRRSGAVTRRATPNNARLWPTAMRCGSDGSLMVAAIPGDRADGEALSVSVWPPAGPSRRVPLDAGADEIVAVDLAADGGLLALERVEDMLWLRHVPPTGPSGPRQRIQPPAAPLDRVLALPNGAAALLTGDRATLVGPPTHPTTTLRGVHARTPTGGLVACDGATVRWATADLNVTHATPLPRPSDDPLTITAVHPWGRAAVVVWRDPDGGTIGLSVVDPRPVGPAGP